MKNLKTIWVALISLTLAAPAFAGHGKKMDIVDTAVNAGTFETLVAAAKAAGLAGALKGDGPLTVFAPTDEAFGALPAGTIESLLKPENREQLATILKYHVIAGKVGSSALADGARLETLAGIDAVISETEKGFNIENARIVATDIDASNGVVHVIAAVRPRRCRPDSRRQHDNSRQIVELRSHLRSWTRGSLLPEARRAGRAC